MLQLTAHDGFVLDAYLARPTGPTKGGLVVVQEMYGVNNYLRAVCTFYASHGYLAIAPALYDRQQRGLVFAYNKDDHDRAQKTYKGWDWNVALDDLDAAKKSIMDAGKVGLVGFCAGGSLAWLAACRRSYSCAVAYYGSLMPDYATEQPRCPVIAHVGENDNTLPAPRLNMFRTAQPTIPIHIYPGAQHGFDNEERVDRYHAEACGLARRRTLEILARHIG